MKIDVKEYLNINVEVEEGRLLRTVKINRLGDWREGVVAVTERKESFPEFLDRDYDTGKLIGMYCVSGSNGFSNEEEKGRYVSFNNVGKQQGGGVGIDNIKFLTGYFTKLGEQVKMKMNTDGTYSVTVNNGLLGYIMNGLVQNKYKGGRKFSDTIVSGSKEYQKGLVAGLLCGGEVTSEGDWMSLTLHGDELLLQVESLLMNTGVEYRVEENERREGNYQVEVVTDAKEVKEVLKNL